jgi:hypothetical protein
LAIQGLDNLASNGDRINVDGSEATFALFSDQLRTAWHEAGLESENLHILPPEVKLQDSHVGLEKRPDLFALCGAAETWVNAEYQEACERTEAVKTFNNSPARLDAGKPDA